MNENFTLTVPAGATLVVSSVGVTPTAISTTAATETTNRFYFLLTLDDGTQIIPMAVRVLVRP